MQHPILKGQTFKVTVPVDFDYLTGGETYLATVRKWGKRTKRAGKIAGVRFDTLDERCGTTIQPWQWARLQQMPGIVVAPA